MSYRTTWRNAILVALLATCAAAAESDLASLEQQAFQAAAEKVAPSVVRIETIGGLERVSDVVFGTGPTSGLVIDADGYIISSAFAFVNKPSSILVRLPDGTRKAADVVATDHNRMIVLLKVKVDKPLPVPEIAPENGLRVGQWAVALGRTFESDRVNVAVGVVSALGRVWGKAIQTDASVSPNNYGGPLVDIRGRVMGVVVPLSPDAAEEVAGVEWYDSGIGFAIPAEFLRSILPQLKKGQDLWPGLAGLGLSGHPLTGDATLALVAPNSPAGEAGLERGDTILEVDGRPIQRAPDLKREIARRYAGDKLRIVARRGETRLERELTLVEKIPPFEHAFLGILPMRTERDPGVEIRYVFTDSPAAKAGLEAGDVITTVAGRAVDDADALRERIGLSKIGQPLEIVAERDGQTRKLAAELAALPESPPPATLPPSGAKPTAERERPATGRVVLRLPEMSNEAIAYVPTNYDPKQSYGLLIWVHGEGGVDAKALLARFEPLCNKHDLIVVVPKAADPKQWVPAELMFVERLLDQVTSTYSIDPLRQVVLGHEASSPLSWTLAQRRNDEIRGVALVDGRILRAPAIDPSHRFAAYLFTAAKGKDARAVEKAIEQLREAKVPVTERSLGDTARPLDDEELADLVRWIDTLDRI